jgi:acetoin utilization deacetylase AcuC-like enzyme
MNIPVKAKTSATDQTRAFEAAIEEISTKVKPDIIFISAGFDAHHDDPLGQLRLEDPDFISMTSTIKEWADEVCEGRIVSCLEGGYNLETLGETVAAHVGELAS